METRKNPEIPMVPKMHLKNVEHQRDQYKSERDKLKDDVLAWAVTCKNLERESNQYKSERDTLIDDIAVLKANISRCRNRAENAMELAESANCEVLRLERANAELMVARDKYTILTNHIRLKAENNPGVSRYIDLVNYIDRLEKKESDTTHHIPHLTNINIKDNTEEPMKFIKRIAKERD